MKSTIAQSFYRDDSDRSGLLDKLRQLSIYTLPFILPLKDKKPFDRQPSPYQSLGANRFQAIGNTIASASFPPDWFAFEIKEGKFLSMGFADPDKVRADMIFFSLSKTEVINQELERMRCPTAFLPFILNELVVGSGCVQIPFKNIYDATYEIRNYRFDNWVCRRDGSNKLLYCTVREMIDPLNMSDEYISKAKLKPQQLKEEGLPGRLKTLFTRSTWQPYSRTWLVEQELNDVIIAESDQETNPFIIGQFNAVPDSDYGFGLAELAHGDLRSFNGLFKAGLEMAGAAGMLKIVVDPRSTIDLDQLEDPIQGKFIAGNVNSNNEVDGLAFIKTDKAQDMNIVVNLAANVEARLQDFFPLDSASRPRGDRVTAFQIFKISSEVESARGAIFQNFADDVQLPLIRRVEMLKRIDGTLPTIQGNLDKDILALRIMTGAAKANRDLEMQRVLTFVQLLDQMGMKDWVNPDKFLPWMASHVGPQAAAILYTPTEKKQADSQRMQEMANQIASQQAAAKTVDVLGNLGQVALQQQALQTV